MGAVICRRGDGRDAVDVYGCVGGGGGEERAVWREFETGDASSVRFGDLVKGSEIEVFCF